MEFVTVSVDKFWANFRSSETKNWLKLKNFVLHALLRKKIEIMKWKYEIQEILVKLPNICIFGITQHPRLYKHIYAILWLKYLGLWDLLLCSWGAVNFDPFLKHPKAKNNGCIVRKTHPVVAIPAPVFHGVFLVRTSTVCLNSPKLSRSHTFTIYKLYRTGERRCCKTKKLFSRNNKKYDVRLP